MGRTSIKSIWGAAEAETGKNPTGTVNNNNEVGLPAHHGFGRT